MEHPVAGNAQGSYLTMRSQEGAIFFVINLVGNFGTVFMDNGSYLDVSHEYVIPDCLSDEFLKATTTKPSQRVPFMPFLGM